MVEYQKHPAMANMRRLWDILGPEDNPDFEDPSGWPRSQKIFEYRRRVRDQHDATVLQPLLEIVVADGLHVRVLEHLVAWLEPGIARYLRDRSALEGPCGNDVLEWPEVEDVKADGEGSPIN